MINFMDAVGLKRTHLIGNCRGGLISISIAAEHPDRVGRLILIGNAGGGIPPELEEKALAPYANYTPTVDNLKSMLSRSYFSVDRCVPPDLLGQYLDSSRRQYDAYAKLGGYPMDVPNLRPLLQKMTVPVLYVVGKENRVLPIEQAIIAFGMTPGSRLYAMTQCGLHPQTEYPEEFNRVATQFLKGDLP
jgi:pimeloyl-ACP methyl ester carboxylesterase